MGYRYDGTYVPNPVSSTSPLDGKKIAFLGDSLTQQSVGYDNAGKVYTHFHRITPNGANPLDGWGRIIVKNHNMTGIEHGRGMQMWFCTADRPEGGTTQVDRLIATDFNPDYIVLELGTNDLTGKSFGTVEDVASQTATTTASAMRYCIETLQATYPSAKLVVVGAMTRKGRGSTYDARQKEYEPLARDILSDYGVPYIDIMREAGISYPMMNTDGIHLAMSKSGGGYENDCEAVRRYARCIESVLMQL